MVSNGDDLPRAYQGFLQTMSGEQELSSEGPTSSIAASQSHGTWFNS